MLVGNTAGYLDYAPDEAFGDALLSAPFRTFTDEELIAYAVRDGKMNYPPGTSRQIPVACYLLPEGVCR
jgi:hypothetical protein